MERLDKLIAACGAASRREVKTLVKQGCVRVDGVLAAAADVKVDENTAVITVDGVELKYEKFVYVLLHKPAGVLSATEDKRQATVLDLLPEEYRKRGIAPVGRLDKDTEGLLLLTDDGELTHRLLSPKYHVDKVYYARVEGTPDEADQAAFAAGMELSDFTCLPAELTLLGEGECLVTVREGKFHQVKRMLASRGKPVTYLKRLSMGPLQLDENVEAGKWRLLEKEEVLALQTVCGLTSYDKAVKK